MYRYKDMRIMEEDKKIILREDNTEWNIWSLYNVLLDLNG